MNCKETLVKLCVPFAKEQRQLCRRSSQFHWALAPVGLQRWNWCLLPVLSCLVFAGVVCATSWSQGVRSTGCKVGVIEGELEAGKDLRRPMGNGLAVWFQATQSGWILRVIPASGKVADHDYAELASPPYHSVTPLALTTDFSFRAQDAIGWNPRRFHFATSPMLFARLLATYEQYQASGWKSARAEAELAEEIGQTSEGKLTILDARLEPGMADQSRMAAAVSSRFESTAHTLVAAPNGKPSDLGRMVWVRFRLEMALPAGFHVERGLLAAGKHCPSL